MAYIATLKAALLAWVKSGTGLGAGFVFFGDQGIPYPTTTFATIRLVTTANAATRDEVRWGAADPVNPAWAPETEYVEGDRIYNGDPGNIYVCTVAGTSAAEAGPSGTGTGIIDGDVEWDYVEPVADLEYVVRGEREVLASIQVWNAPASEGADAMTVIEGVRAALALPSVGDALNNAGVTILECTPTRNLSAIPPGGTSFHGRAQMDVRLSVREEVSETTPSMLSVEVGGNIDEDDDLESSIAIDSADIPE